MNTLSWKETQGVTVTTYQSPKNDFPGFYCRKSGSKVPYNLLDPVDAAKLINAAKEMNLKSGVLIAVPIPKEFSMNGNFSINKNSK